MLSQTQKILYRCYRDGKCVSRSWSITTNEWGEDPVSVERQIEIDLKFYNQYAKINEYDRIECIVDGKVLRELIV